MSIITFLSFLKTLLHADTIQNYDISYELFNYELFSYELFSYELFNYELFSYELFSYGVLCYWYISTFL